MATITTYPTTLDSFSQHSQGDFYAPGQNHTDSHNVLQGAVTALETALGVTGDGYIPQKVIIRANATRTFTSDTNLQAIFTTPAAGSWTAPVGTYLIDGLLYVTSMSGTSGNALIDILGAGTATTAAWVWGATGIDVTDPTAAATQTGSFAVTKTSVASIVTATTGTQMAINIKGSVEVTVTGTVIPSLQMVTASASVVSIGSYITFERVGTSVAITSIGPVA